MLNQTQERPSVLFFDVNETLLDLSPLKQRIDKVLLTEGSATQWFTMMLQYSLVMTVSGTIRIACGHRRGNTSNAREKP
jgi:hypothetical protein